MHLPPPSVNNIREIMLDLDEDKDGMISFAEFEPLIFKLLYREGFLHIDHDDLIFLKSLNFKPYCEKMDEVIQKLLPVLPAA